MPKLPERACLRYYTPFALPRLADRLEATFSRTDLDGDGQISREEFDRESDRLFRFLDTNGDGVIGGMELGSVNSALLGDICQFPDTGAAPSRRR